MPGGDAVHADVVRREVDRGRLAELHDGRLRGAVDDRARAAGGRGDRRGVHDRAAALLGHAPRRPLRAEHDALEVDTDDGVEVGEVVVDEAVELAADPRVVEHDVEAAELLDREVDRRLHVVGVAHVDALERDRVAQLGGELLTASFVDVGDDDPCVLGDEPLDGRLAEAAGSAGDDRDLPRELPHGHAPFSIHELRARVHSVPGEDVVDRRAIVGLERPVERGGVVVDLGDRSAADERRGHARRRGRPPERELGDRVTRALREVAQVVDDGDVLGDPTGAEEVLEQRRHHAPLVGLRAPVVGGEGVVSREGAAQEPVGERAVAEEAHVVRRAPREASRLPCGDRTARNVLHDVDAAHLRARLHLVEGEVRERDEAHLAGADHLVECAQCLLERGVAVGPVHGVHVDVVGAEPPQAGVDRRVHALGPTVAEVGAVGVAGAELGGDDRLVAPAAQCASERLLGCAEAVGLGSVEEVDADVERVADGARRTRARRCRRSRHLPPGSRTRCRDLHTGGAEGPLRQVAIRPSGSARGGA